MSQEDRASTSGKRRLVKWAVLLVLAAALAWLGAYILGVQIYDAAVQVTH
jgi:hypothetical protein